MKYFILFFLIISQFSLADEYTSEFPQTPLENLTPGELCKNPSEYRYPERIPYCERDVSGAQKQEVFAAYRREGFGLNPRTRSSYKIDHLIPLCAGGSNNFENLWPQHRSVYEITDPIEQIGCEKMKLGLLKQAKFIQLLKKAKKDLSKARMIFLEISGIN